MAWVALAEILQSNSKAPSFDALAPLACMQGLSQKVYIQRFQKVSKCIANVTTVSVAETKEVESREKVSTCQMMAYLGLPARRMQVELS